MHSVVLLSALVSLPAAAVPPRYSGDVQGQRVVSTSAIYDPGQQTLQVGGAMAGVSAAQLQGGYTVFYNGVVATVSGGRTAQLSAVVPIGPDYLGAPQPWPATLPFVDRMANSTYVPKPVVMEIASNATQQVVYRYRSTFFDLRQDEQVLLAGPARIVDDGLVAQLTPDGLSRLAPVHEADLPWPDAAAFDAELDVRLPDIAIETGNGSCESVARLSMDDPEWLSLPAYLTLLATASGLVAAGTCSNPPSSIDLCVGTVEAEVVDLDVPAVSVNDLLFGPMSGEVDAEIDLVAPSATIEGRLRDLTMRYECGTPGTPPAEVPIAQDTIDNRAWLSDFATCPDLGMSAVAPRETAPYLLATEADRELVDVQSLGPVLFDLAPGWSSQSGTCADNWINADVAAILPGLELGIEAAISGAFNDGAPETSQAQALDELFDPWQLGTFPVSDATFLAEIRELVSDPTAGLVTRWFTSLDTTDPAYTPRLLNPWLYKAAMPYGFDVSPDGLDPEGFPFDASFSVSTTHLNQHLRTKSATDGAWLTLAPSWADLGLQPPAGVAATDPAPLTGNVLGQWFAPFAGYGASELTITVTPTMSPFVFMDPDTGFQPGDTPVGFFYPQVRVDFATVRPVATVASVVVDLWDPDLALDLDGSGVLWGEVDTPVWYALATKTPPGCPMQPLLNLPAFANGCDDSFAVAVQALVSGEILATTDAMLDEIAALDHVETPSGGPERRDLSPTRQYQHGMYVRWFADLVP